MDTMTNNSDAENAVLGEENFICSNSEVLMSCMNIKSAEENDDKHVTNHKNHVIPNTPNQKPQNEIPSEFETLLPEFSAGSCSGSVNQVPEMPVSKVVSPTIFENAVQIVKNLFSPAKAHALFTPTNPTTGIIETVTKKELELYESTESGSVTPVNLDQLVTSRKSSFSLNISETGNSPNGDWNNTSVKNSSSISDKHDNTNDSYLTTASGIDESFQSTVTHFEEITADAQKAHDRKTHVLNGLLNESCENNLDDTLTKNQSIGPSEDGVLNSTFQVPINGERGTSRASVEPEQETFTNNVAILETHISNQNDSENECTSRETLDTSKSYVIVNAQSSKNTAELYNEECCVEFAKSTPNKITSLKNVNSSNRLFVDIVSEKMERLTIQDEDSSDNQSTYSCAVQDADEEASAASQFSTTNHSSETDFSVVSERSDCALLEKFSAPKSSAELGNNFSTSTIIISKAELGQTNIVKNECVLSPSLQISEAPAMRDSASIMSEQSLVSPQGGNGNDEVFIENSTVRKSSSERNPSVVLDDSLHLNDVIADSSNSISTKSGESVIERKFHFETDSLTSNILASELQSSSVVELDLKTLDLTDTVDGKGVGECFPNESGIPLASQKSYTVLHNSNPDLSRPIVEDEGSAIPNDKINDVLLINDSISQLTMNCDRPEGVVSIAASNDGNVCNDVDSLKRVEDVPDFNLMDTSSHSSKLSEKVNNITNDIEEDLEICRLSPTSSVGSRAITVCELEANVAASVLSEDKSNSSAVSDKLVPKSASVEIISNDGALDGISGDAASDIVSNLSNSAASVPKDLIKEHVHGNDESAICPEVTSAVDNPTKKDNERTFDITSEVARVESVIKNDLIEIKSSGSGDVEGSSSDTDSCRVNDGIDSKVKLSCKDGGFDIFSGCDDFVIPWDEPRDTCEADLSQLIQEQFTANDIAKICSVVNDLPEMNLRRNIALVSEQFEKSFHEKIVNESAHQNTLEEKKNGDNQLSPACLDFLESISGKPSVRDYSRDSLYIKFDPLVQGGKTASKMTSISEVDKENLITSPVSRATTNSCEPLIPITPLKQTASINSLRSSPVLSPSKKNEAKASSKLREMVNEINRLKEMYKQREELHKEKMNNYEKEVTRLTGQKCVLEDKLKESEERQNSLVKKLNAQEDSLTRMSGVLAENLAYIETLTSKYEALQVSSLKEISDLRKERDNYLSHLESTEQALMGFYGKYEKCKKTIETYKRNEETYRERMEELSEAVKDCTRRMEELKERAEREVRDLSQKMNEMRDTHAQDVCRFKAQLRKTELKAQAIEESLQQKIKENQALAGICDELIGGKN